MDPTACYRETIEAIEADDMETADERAHDLNDWLRKGGFWPEGYTRDEVREMLALAMIA
jgi:hypothetical protein